MNFHRLQGVPHALIATGALKLPGDHTSYSINEIPLHARGRTALFEIHQNIRLSALNHSYRMPVAVRIPARILRGGLRCRMVNTPKSFSLKDSTSYCFCSINSAVGATNFDADCKAVPA